MHPDVRESITVSDSASAGAAVEAGAADVGLVGELPCSSALAARPITHDELIFVVAPTHPLADRKRISLQRLIGEKLIMRESGSGSRRCFEHSLEAAGISPADLNVVMEINSNDVICDAVSRGIGSAFLSRTVVASRLDDGVLVSVHVEKIRPRRLLYVITPKKDIQVPVVRAFLAYLEKWKPTVSVPEDANE